MGRSQRRDGPSAAGPKRPLRRRGEETFTGGEPLDADCAMAQLVDGETIVLRACCAAPAAARSSEQRAPSPSASRRDAPRCAQTRRARVHLLSRESVHATRARELHSVVVERRERERESSVRGLAKERRRSLRRVVRVGLAATVRPLLGHGLLLLRDLPTRALAAAPPRVPAARAAHRASHSKFLGFLSTSVSRGRFHTVSEFGHDQERPGHATRPCVRAPSYFHEPLCVEIRRRSRSTRRAPHSPRRSQPRPRLSQHATTNARVASMFIGSPPPLSRKERQERPTLSEREKERALCAFREGRHARASPPSLVCPQTPRGRGGTRDGVRGTRGRRGHARTASRRRALGHQPASVGV